MNQLFHIKRILRLWWNKPHLMKKRCDQYGIKQRALRRLRRKDEESACRAEYRKQARPKSSIPPYLSENRWEEELNYKLWSTKGARFVAARRCDDKDTSSQWAITLLTGYLIILGLIPFVPLPLFKAIPADVVSLFTTAVSILLLAYSLLISARGYSLQSYRFHECALRLASLYNDLRQAKEIADDLLKREEIARITKEYSNILENYPNHDHIDHDIFQIAKRGYFKLSQFECWWRGRLYYIETKGLYHVCVALPPLVCGLAVFWWWWSGGQFISVKAN